MLIRVAACLLLLSAVVASAKPPPGSDPESPVAKWFARQTNMRGGSCCGLGDGHRLEDNQWRLVSGKTGSHYEVQIDGKWHPIEEWQTRKALTEDPNPTGVAVVWYSNVTVEGSTSVTIYCFAPGTVY